MRSEFGNVTKEMHKSPSNYWSSLIYLTYYLLSYSLSYFIPLIYHSCHECRTPHKKYPLNYTINHLSNIKLLLFQTNPQHHHPSHLWNYDFIKQKPNKAKNFNEEKFLLKFQSKFLARKKENEMKNIPNHFCSTFSFLKFIFFLLCLVFLQPLLVLIFIINQNMSQHKWGVKFAHFHHQNKKK